MEAVGINIATDPVRPAPSVDDANTRNIIVNNTIWFGPNANQGGTGIQVGVEGTGHIIANNTITYSAASTGGNGSFNCFNYSLTNASYAFINNNHCYTPLSNHSWDLRRGNLTAWQSNSGFDMASTLLDDVNPLFTTAGTNFKPASGSPLINKGNITYGFSYIGAIAP